MKVISQTAIGRRDIPTGTESGFTMIELLAVVAICGVLAVLIFPAVQSSQRNAMDIRTVTRMKALSAAYMGFMSENNQKIVEREDGKTASATTGEITEALAPFLPLSEKSAGARLASSVWWDGMAEKNGNRVNSTNGEGDLYYPGDPAWPGGPPRSKLTGMYFNPFAHKLPAEASSDPDYRYSFSTLSQVQYPGKTALLISCRKDRTSGDAKWNSWSDGRKFNASNPLSIGAKRMICYFDGHVDSVIISKQSFAGGPNTADEVRASYIFAEPVFYAWPGR